jgi:hypothetical protein
MATFGQSRWLWIDINNVGMASTPQQHAEIILGGGGGKLPANREATIFAEDLEHLAQLGREVAEPGTQIKQRYALPQERLDADLLGPFGVYAERWAKKQVETLYRTA